MHIFRHFRTITHHRHLVVRHCFRCGIPWQGLKHDLSKYSPAEFLPGCKYCTGKHSPNEEERNDKGFSAAWMHHKGRNRHHYEYWIDVSPVSHRYEPVKMPYRYLIEMFCDRVAASKNYRGKDYTDDSALDYFLKRKDRVQMHPDTSAELERLLTMLRDKGEKETFAYVKKTVKEMKKTPFAYGGGGKKQG